MNGETVTSIAHRFGVDATTVMACAATVGIDSPRRPKLLKAPLRRELICALQAGQEKSHVAAQLGLSVSTVTRTLRTEVGLRAAWTNARFEAAQRHARDTWREIVEANPSSGVKALRLLEAAVYAWLYRNDRAWLNEQCKLLKGRTTMARPSSIRWDERDRDLAAAVQKVVVALVEAQPGQPIALWQIYQRLPELKAKLSKLDRMPLTHRALRQSVGRRAKGVDV
jgi:Tn7-like transposition protein D